MTVATFAAAQLLKLLPRVRLSQAVGKLCEQPLPAPVSRFVLNAYARAYNVNLAEAEVCDGYPCFDDFFTRRLRPGVRPIAQARIVSPSDGNIVAVGDILSPGAIEVKGRPYEVAELIGSEEDSSRYIGGEFAVVYLHPRDYHRVHSPVTGRIAELRVMPGDLYPVNAIGERHFPRLFVRNKRSTIVIDTDDDDLGRVTLVMVGATIVGKISLMALGEKSTTPGDHPLNPPLPIARGEEVGIFHLGSTVVVLFERKGLLSRATGPVCMGESLERS